MIPASEKWSNSALNGRKLWDAKRQSPTESWRLCGFFTVDNFCSAGRRWIGLWQCSLVSGKRLTLCLFGRKFGELKFDSIRSSFRAGHRRRHLAIIYLSPAPTSRFKRWKISMPLKEYGMSSTMNTQENEQ